MKNIVIINYNMGNIKSVENAFKRIGADIKVTASPAVIKKADAVVLPGVGAYKDAIKNLQDLDLIKPIREAISGKIFLGICIGMQVLFEFSMEGGRHKGLGVFKGGVRKIPPSVKVPHMGWNEVTIIKKDSKIFTGVENNQNFYFVHSYYVDPEDKSITSGIVDYGVKMTASIEKDNIFGFQFHPEKSSILGLKLLENFWNIVK
jgi:imidazole glycerol-phosphate synthase subunit HisH